MEDITISPLHFPQTAFITAPETNLPIPAHYIEIAYYKETDEQKPPRQYKIWYAGYVHINSINQILNFTSDSSHEKGTKSASNDFVKLIKKNMIIKGKGISIAHAKENLLEKLVSYDAFGSESIFKSSQIKHIYGVNTSIITKGEARVPAITIITDDMGVHTAQNIISRMPENTYLLYPPTLYALVFRKNASITFISNSAIPEDNSNPYAKNVGKKPTAARQPFANYHECLDYIKDNFIVAFTLTNNGKDKKHEEDTKLFLKRNQVIVFTDYSNDKKAEAYKLNITSGGGLEYQCKIASNFDLYRNNTHYMPIDTYEELMAFVANFAEAGGKQT